MPRGQYERKPRTDAEPPAPGAAKALKRKHAKKANGAKPGKPVGAATFVVNDRGAMQIMDGQQVINLERDDVKRLELFLANSKGLRRA